LLYQAGGFAMDFVYHLHSKISTSEIAQSEKVVVKLPIALPYSTNWEAPKEVNKKVQKGDEFYQMVEQRMENDTLYTTMIADHSARESFMELSQMVSQHLKQDASNDDQPTSSLINLLIKEYCNSKNVVTLYILDWSQTESNFSCPIITLSAFQSSIFSPPRSC